MPMITLKDGSRIDVITPVLNTLFADSPVNLLFPSLPPEMLAKLQRDRNREASRQLESARLWTELKQKRHGEILDFTREFLEKPNKGFFSRLFYDILWKAAVKISSRKDGF